MSLTEWFCRPHWCAVCRRSVVDTVHHRIPKSRARRKGILGDPDDDSNLCTLCLQCHARYHDVVGQIPYMGCDSRKVLALGRQVGILLEISASYILALPEYARVAARMYKDEEHRQREKGRDA